MSRNSGLAILFVLGMTGLVAGCDQHSGNSPMAPTATSTLSSSVGATITSGVSSGSDHSSPPIDDEREIEGLVTAVPPTTASGQFTVAGVTVITTPTTTYKTNGHTGLFADILVGVRVHVKGQTSSTGGVTASDVIIQNEIQAPPPGNQDNDDADDDHPGEVKISGSVSGLGGTCPTLKFVVGSTSIVTVTSTRFDLACASVKNTTHVEVRGTRAANGVVTALRVKKD